jgi:hypothetical protein
VRCGCDDPIAPATKVEALEGKSKYFLALDRASGSEAYAREARDREQAAEAGVK